MVWRRDRRLFARLQPWLGAAALVGLGWFFYANRAEFATVVDLRLPYLLLVAAGCAILTAARAWMFRISYAHVTDEIDLLRWWAIGVVASILNQLLVSSAGVAYRAVWLKVKARVGLLDTLALQIAYVACLLGVASGIGAGTMAMVLGTRVASHKLFWVFLAVTTTVVASVALFLAIRVPSDNAARAWVQAIGRLQVALRKPHVLSGLLGTNVVVVVVGGMLFWSALAGMGHPIGLVDSVLYGTALGLSNLVIITPGNLGIMEAVSGGMAVALGGALELGVAAAVAIRVVNVSTLALLGMAAWPMLRDHHAPPSATGAS